MSRPGGAERRAARRAERRAWAQKHSRTLIGFFALLIAVGIVLGKIALIGAGIAGLVWILLASRR